jgi:hypothetical protein
MSEDSNKEDIKEFRVEGQGRKLHTSSFCGLEKSITQRSDDSPEVTLPEAIFSWNIFGKPYQGPPNFA